MKTIDIMNKIVNEQEIPDHFKIVDFDFYKDELPLPEIFEKLYYDDIGLLDDVEVIISPEDRIQKAIEYTEKRKTLNWYADGVFVEELLDILKGEDNDK